MFTDLICDDWDSTKNQDDFIESYFNITEVNLTKTSSLSKTRDKRKKEKKSLFDTSLEYHSEIQSQFQKTESSNLESNQVKKKKKKSKNKNISNEFSEKIKGTEVSNSETITTCNFSANLINETGSQENEIDSNCLKLKKKKKRLRNKTNSISEPIFSVSGETETISDIVFNDSSVANIDSSENNSGHNMLKIRKRKKKLKNTQKSSEADDFSDGVEISNFEGHHNMPIKKHKLPEITSNTVSNGSNNFDGNCLKKKKIKNSGKSFEDDEFSVTAEHKNFGDSCNLTAKKPNLLQNKAYQKLQAAKFRYLNEMLYTNSGKDALSYFQQNTDEFVDYHHGYQSQVSKWPINPVDIIIQEISQINKQAVIADLGCGEAKISEVFPTRTVHSFDLIALKDCVTACDMTNVPLQSKTVDVVVFCLSLMGTNWKDYLKEAYRILKLGGVMKIAEIESRIENLQPFIKEIENFGFSLINQNLSHKMFIFFNFKKGNRSKKPSKGPAVTLKPCLYKKR